MHDFTYPERTVPSWLALMGWVALSLVAGSAGSVVSGPDAWYQALDKPSWTPASWLFGPVWTTLYILMGVAVWLVWRQPETRFRNGAIALYLIQLALNAVWSFIFFGWHWIGLAFADILILWLAIAATIGVFARIRRLAGMLMLPYLAWVSYAAALNGAIWLRN